MIIETSRAKYEVFLEMIQFEITGRCNMRCEHCRAWQEPRKDMAMEMISKVLDFALPEASSEMRFTISGGEPFLHPQLIKIIKLIKERVSESNKIKKYAIAITTNGSLVTKEKIKQLEELNIKKLYIQVSIDSSNPQIHDNFRSFPGAFERAVKTIKLLTKTKLIPQIRATVVPATVSGINDLVFLAKKYGVKRIGFGSVIPTGRGRLNSRLIFTPLEKKRFLEKVTETKINYPEMEIFCEDPLRFAIDSKAWDYGKFDYKKPNFIEGCSAGITMINVQSDGILTPCSMLLKPILNIKDKTPQEILKTYTSSKIIHNLIERKVKGKCAQCELKRLCGGCRAVAEGIMEDCFAEDPTCWK